MTRTTHGKAKVQGTLLPLLTGYEKAMTWATRHERVVLLGAFLLALLIRVLYMALLVGLGSPPTYDGIMYHGWASEILQEHSFTLAGQPTAVKLPGYPLALAAVYFLFGYNFAIGRLMQAVVSALTCLVVYFLGKELFDRRVGLWALLGMVFYPLFIYMAGEFYPDTLALLPACLALLVAAKMVRNDKWGLPVILGLLLGAAIMLRPQSSLLLPLLGLWQFVCFRWRRALRNAVLLALGWLLVFSPWIVRNYLVFNEFIPLASAGGTWGGANPLAPLARGRGVPVRIWAGTDPRSAEILQELSEMHGGLSIRELFGSEPPQSIGGMDFYGWPGLTETENDRRFSQLAKEWILQHPGEYLGLIPWKLLRAWSPASFGVAFSREQDPRLLALVTPPYLLFLVLAFYGLIRFGREWRKLFLAYSPLIAVSLTAVLTFGATRHALIMHPALILFAAVGLEGLLVRLGQRQPAPLQTLPLSEVQT